MSEQEIVLLKQLEAKQRSSSEEFLYEYLKTQQRLPGHAPREEQTVSQ